MGAWRNRVSGAVWVVVVLAAGCGGGTSLAPPPVDGAGPVTTTDGPAALTPDAGPVADGAAGSDAAAMGEGGASDGALAPADAATGDAPAKTATGLTIAPTEAHLRAGETFSFQARATFSDASSTEVTGQVTWSSSDLAVATIDQGGLASGLTAGMVTIKAGYQGLEASATLVVRVATASAVMVSPAQAILDVGETAPLQALLVFSDGSSKDVSSEVGWSSSNETAATVDRFGVVTGKAAGSADITARLLGFSAISQVTVSNARLLALRIEPAALSVPAGQTRAFSLAGDFEGGLMRNLTRRAAWSSSKPGVATVGSGVKGGLVVGVAAGTTTITASYLGIDATAPVTVP